MIATFAGAMITSEAADRVARTAPSPFGELRHIDSQPNMRRADAQAYNGFDGPYEP
jgi:hypothetical protein